MKGPTACLFAAQLACTGLIEMATSGAGPSRQPVPAAEVAGCAPSTFAFTRLNRRELNATFAAVLGDTTGPASLFPADSISFGAFDNASGELSIAPRLVVDLEAAAGHLIDAAWARDEAVRRPQTNSGPGGGTSSLRLLGRQAQATTGAARGDEWNLWSNGEARFVFQLASDGLHLFELEVYGEHAGADAVRMEVWVNDSLVRSETVSGTAASKTRIAFERSVSSRALTLGLRFTNDFYDAATRLDRNLVIASVTVSPKGAAGLPGASAPSSPKTFLQVCDSTNNERACAETMVRRFARRAWRRHATSPELAQLMELYDATRADNDDFSTSVKLALKAVLVSPSFLLRSEAIVPAQGLRSAEAVAARLSFFLWGSPPDETLDRLVDDGLLLAPETLRSQVDRMLMDPKASALREHLVGQWFNTRNVKSFALDPVLFPGVNQAVMEGMQKQIEGLIEEFFFQDRDVLDVFDAPVTYLDAPLAQFLDFSPPAGGGVERRTLPANDIRAGFIAQSAPLVVTSKSTETDPPRRGQWVLERLLCQPMALPTNLAIPPTPPASTATPTARHRLEQLTAQPACAGCHALLNPIGFGLENYAADSRYRALEHGAAIDPSGVFRGAAFQTPAELFALLKRSPDLERCMVRQTLSYALNRPVSDSDEDTVKALQANFGKAHRYLELVKAVALSSALAEGCHSSR
jgi:hypothetical protein